jgi:hypothetical protein
MSNQTINIGNQPNDGTGDSIYVAFQKVNANFQEVYTLLGFGAGFSFLRLKESPAALQPNAVLQVNSVGTKFINKTLVAGTGMQITLTTSTIEFINTASSLIADSNPRLSADISGQSAFSLINMDVNGPKADYDAVSRKWIYENFVNRDGITDYDNTSSSELQYNGLSTIRLPVAMVTTATSSTHLVNKGYVDNLVETSGFVSNVNYFVTLDGDDTRYNIPSWKRGRANAYAFKTVNRAAVAAEQAIRASQVELGVYQKTLTFSNSTQTAVVASVTSSTILPAANFGQQVAVQLDIPSYNLGTDPYKTRSIYPGLYLLGAESGAIGLIESIVLNNGTGVEYYDVTPVDYAKTYNVVATPNATSGEVTFTLGVGTTIDIPDFWVGYKFTVSNGSNAVVSYGIITEINTTLDDSNNVHDTITVDFSTGVGLSSTSVIAADRWHVYAGDFFVGEPLQWGQRQVKTQSTIVVESGEHHDEYPIKISDNVSIRGDEFRRTVLKPGFVTNTTLPSISASKWANTYFYRDTQVDGIRVVQLSTSTDYKSAVAITADNYNNDPVTGVINISLASGTAPSTWVGKVFVWGTASSPSGQGVITAVNAGTFSVNLAQNAVYQREMRSYTAGTSIASANWHIYAPINYGYHYLRDASRKVDTLTTQTNYGGYTNSANNIELNRQFIQKEVTAYLALTYANPAGSFVWNSLTAAQKLLCERDVGYIVDALVEDLRNGGDNKSINAGDSYRTVALVKGAQLIPTLEAVNRINFVGQLIANDEVVTSLQSSGGVLQTRTSKSAESGSRAILRDLTNAIYGIINNDPDFNPPKYNDEMDMFLMNDSTMIRYVSAQGHGGFMKVLDPDGQILAKSPYTQTASSFSRSDNRQVFRGGFFVDGFAGNTIANLTTATIVNNSQGYPVKINITGVRALGRPSINGDGTFIKPITPTFFIHRGVTYEVSYIGEYNSTLGNGSINLNPLRPGGVASVTTASGTYFKTGIGTSTVPVRFTYPTQPGGLAATGTAVINSLGTVTAINVSFPGSGYNNGTFAESSTAAGAPKVIIGGARISWTRNAAGSINGYSIIDGGSGYAATNQGHPQNTPINFPTDAGGAGATAYVNDVDSNGKILTITISAAGSGYTSDPTVTFGNAVAYTVTVKPGFITTTDHPLPSSVTLVTAGNRSMLANDFTQINDLGYGIFATNGGFIENVSMFSYYCHSSYYALNGAQLRTITGSSAYGNYGLISEGSDPLEVPIAVKNKRAMSQVALTTSTGVYVNRADDFTIYVRSTSYEPPSQGQLEINHKGVIQNYNIKSAVQVENGVYSLSIDDGSGGGLVKAVDDTDPVTIRVYYNQDILDVNAETLTRPSTVLTYAEDPTYVYRILSYTNLGGDTARAEGSTPYNYILLDPYSESSIANRQGLGQITITSAGSGFASTTVQYPATISTPSTAGTATVNGTQADTDLVTITGAANTIMVGSRVTLTSGGADPNGAPTYVLWVNDAKTQIRVDRTWTWTNTTGLTFSGTQAVGYGMANSSGNITKVVLTNQGAGYAGTSARNITITGGAVNATATAYADGIAGTKKIKVVELSAINQARLATGFSNGYYYTFAYEGNIYKITGYTNATTTQNEWGEVAVERLSDSAALQHDIISNTLKAGIVENQSGSITVKISTLRATSHDMVDVGTGGYSATRIPNDLYGPPDNAPDQSKEVKELGKGRVYYVTADQDGNFRVGPYFSVDQGRGTVSISAPISLTNVDGISFKRGQTLVQVFSVDGTMGAESNNSVPTEKAIVSYVNSRLGLTRSGALVSSKLGSGYLDLSGTQEMVGPVKSNDIRPVANNTYAVGTTSARYNEMWANDFRGTATTALAWDTSRTVTFAGGDVTGSFSIKGNADVSNVALTIAADSVALGTDTTGNYVQQGGTSGYGLSGSVNSEGGTFTVTSNGTSTNTASTLVYRDGSGNFAANVITASEFVADKLTIQLTTITTTVIQTDDIIKTSNATDSSSSTDTAASFSTAGGASVAKKLYAGSLYDSNNRVLTGITQGSGIAISGSAPTLTVAHADTSAVANLVSDNSGNTFIQDLTLQFDEFGHVTGTNVVTATAQINTGILTLATSGKGISGSQTFSANDPDSKTFTVTVNSTSSYATETIMYRDGNGAFAALAATIGDGDTGTVNFGNSDNSGIVPTNQTTAAQDYQGGFSINNKAGTGGLKTISLQINGNEKLQANATGGQFSGAWTLASGATLQATYADLAEKYLPDAHYEPGTVMIFGGDNEVTAARDFMDRRIAGVVSTNPAYMMNSEQEGGIYIALTGRVPCRVVGKIRKGDMLVASGAPGIATAEKNPALGSVIGKALQDYDGQTIGVIEVVVGRI